MFANYQINPPSLNYAKLILRKWGQKVVGEFNIDTTNTKQP